MEEDLLWEYDQMADEDPWPQEGEIVISNEKGAGAVTSLVLGIISSLAWIMPIICLPITVVGIVLGAINMTSRRHKGMAISGFVINIVFLSITIAKGIVDIIRYYKAK